MMKWILACAATGKMPKMSKNDVQKYMANVDSVATYTVYIYHM